MARKTGWQIPDKRGAQSLREPARAVSTSTAIDPASADFNLPISEQHCFEPENSVEESVNSAMDEQAEAELKRITPPNSALLELADRFPAPDDWYAE